jgi:hypothetical protein
LIKKINSRKLWFLNCLKYNHAGKNLSFNNRDTSHHIIRSSHSLSFFLTCSVEKRLIIEIWLDQFMSTMRVIIKSKGSQGY